MNKIMGFSSIFVSVVILIAPQILAQVDLDIETGAVFSGYNDVKIPGDKGTLFSLSEELDADPGVFYRIRLFYHFNDRHHVGALYAPLSIHSAGQLDRDLLFEGETFPAQTPLESTYMFNSYRLIYRYDFLRKEKVDIGLGFTAKIRDAKIAVKGDGLASEKTNVGFVPIVHFRLLFKFADRFALLLDGDALAAPQGRAEDVLAAVIFKASEKIDVKAGYRILEGGADNDEVYNFSLINYAAVGAIFHF
ncbi:hypothetical protein JXA02_14445 [candidate division KSB1 bacterium]|nr:hypothetical protein [candidate division KSB1 bacterium]